MTSVTTKPDSSQPAAETAVYLFDNWFDPIEGGLRDRVREFIHAMIEGELDIALSRPRYARHAKSPNGEAEEAVGATGHRSLQVVHEDFFAPVSFGGPGRHRLLITAGNSLPRPNRFEPTGLPGNDKTSLAIRGWTHRFV